MWKISSPIWIRPSPNPLSSIPKPLAESGQERTLRYD
jgi:hypothetical protein